jgi:hypothetical protein
MGYKREAGRIEMKVEMAIAGIQSDTTDYYQQIQGLLLVRWNGRFLGLVLHVAGPFSSRIPMEARPKSKLKLKLMQIGVG